MTPGPHGSRDGTGAEAPWWKTAVVYQIWPRSFADGNGDGVGDLAGIADHLDHLDALGVDVVWLSPVYRSPQDDAGYDISDYHDVDPTFGSLDELDALLDALHQRGMKLIMDLVVNHTSDQHPWFAQSRASRQDPKRDWYWWRPARDGMEPGEPGAEPNNWGSMFGGSAWQLDEATGEYYLHLFSATQPDLNWENVEVRQAVYEMMRWWLDRGIDGFRMDVINFISKDVTLPDAHVPEDERYGNGMPYFVDGPRIHEFLQEMHRQVFAGREGLLTVGEMPGVTVAEAKLYTDPDRRELDMVFQFEHMAVDHGPGGRFDLRPLHLPALKAALNRWQRGLAEVGWNSLYWDNHDQPRVVSRFGDDGEHRVRSAKLLATVLHLHHGTPYIHQGDELGMTNHPFSSLDDFQDVQSRNHVRESRQRGVDDEHILAALRAGARDNARTPMQWDDGEDAGFTTGTPWMVVNPNHVEINAADQRDDPDSVFNHYRRLVQLRHDLPVVAFGRFTMLLADHEQVYAFTRRLDDVELLVLANFSGDRVPVEVPEVERWADAELLLGNVGDPGPLDGPVALEPWEARAYLRGPAQR